MTKANNSVSMRENNRLVILNHIRKNPISRADLARETGLTRAAVTIITDSLVEEGIIQIGEVVKSESGRRPTMLCLNPNAYVSVGIDISRDGCAVVFTDFSGNKLLDSKFAFGESADDTVKEVCSYISSELEMCGYASKALGVCICSPGPIDFARGVILTPSRLELFHNFDIVASVSSYLNLPVYLEKDTNVLAIAEKNLGDFDKDMMLLIADHGIGCSIIKGGRIFSGRDGMGCEIGHTTVDINGDVCACGNIGCAELYASIPAIVKKMGAKSWTDLIESAKGGDPSSSEALMYQSKILSILCVNAANLFEVENIVLGGELVEADFIVNDVIDNALKKSAMSRGLHGFSVSSSRLGENARAYAAAVTVTEKYFNGEMNL